MYLHKEVDSNTYKSLQKIPSGSKQKYLKKCIYFSLLINKIFKHLKMINSKYFNQKVLDVSKPLQLQMESDNVLKIVIWSITKVDSE